MGNAISILIVDDHELVREGLAALLETKSDFQVIGVAADGDEAVAKAKELHPDVILLDLIMPNKDGLTAIPEILADNPEAKILVLSSFSQGDKVRAALEAGALGYQLKESSPSELIQSIQTVFQGQLLLHPSVARKFFTGAEPPDQPIQANGELTERETAVLELVAYGFANREIAQRLNISPRTASTHVSRILSKLGLDNRTQAALFAFREGLVDQDLEP
ncbi:MAG: response regulator transcription factor [Chloroflexi bacterium]|nr:response regulator transcription factor [Chloroflexota bacterium]MBP7042830.1 response regulator transcription factor [Chloroflexota bacterium]